MGMSEEENDTGLATVGVEQALNKELGEEKWHQILAYLFFLTTDSTVAVRQTAFQVWKSVVSNTPRTLKTCIEDVTTLCIRLLSGEDENKRLLASRCLGEVVQKLAEYVLPTLIPLLQKKLTSEDEHIKQVYSVSFLRHYRVCAMVWWRLFNLAPIVTSRNMVRISWRASKFPFVMKMKKYDCSFCLHGVGTRGFSHCSQGTSEAWRWNSLGEHSSLFVGRFRVGRGEEDFQWSHWPHSAHYHSRQDCMESSIERDSLGHQCPLPSSGGDPTDQGSLGGSRLCDNGHDQVHSFL